MKEDQIPKKTIAEKRQFKRKKEELIIKITEKRKFVFVGKGVKDERWKRPKTQTSKSLFSKSQTSKSLLGQMTISKKDCEQASQRARLREIESLIKRWRH